MSVEFYMKGNSLGAEEWAEVVEKAL